MREARELRCRVVFTGNTRTELKTSSRVYGRKRTRKKIGGKGQKKNMVLMLLLLLLLWTADEGVYYSYGCICDYFL